MSHAADPDELFEVASDELRPVVGDETGSGQRELSVRSLQRRTKSITWSRLSWGTHWLLRSPQDFFLGPRALPSARPAPRPSSSAWPRGTRYAAREPRPVVGSGCRS